MAGKKRAPEVEPVVTRSSKSAKTEGAKSATTSRGGRKKAPVAASAFTNRSTPLLVNILYPPTPAAEGNDATETSTATADSPGLVGSVMLTPTTFSTGSFGWKASKKLMVELPDPSGGGEEMRVQVMLTLNAVVMGSKFLAKEDDDEHNVVAKAKDAKNGQDDKNGHDNQTGEAGAPDADQQQVEAVAEVATKED